MSQPASCSDISILDNNQAASSCSDIGSYSLTRNLDLNGLVNNTCVEFPVLYASEDDTPDQNLAFDISMPTGDVRVSETNILNSSLLILNTDLINLVDTGLIECVESGRNERWDTPCDSADIGPKGNYLKQDAVETDHYPKLAFTYVTDGTQPSLTKPNTDDGEQFCFQDNSTGLIWSDSSSLTQFNSIPTLDSCDLPINSWRLPTVQELITIMELNPVGDTKPLQGNILNLEKSGNNFWEHHSKYWSSDECNIGGVSGGRWVVDLLSGHVECSGIDEADTNFAIKVYK
jgi:hypothetical protein